MMYEAGSEATGAPSLEDYIDAVKARKWLVLLTTLLALGLGFLLLQLQPERYTASARVLVGVTPVGSTDSRLVAPELERETEVIDSLRTAEVAIEQIGPQRVPEQDALYLISNLEVQFRPDSDVLRLSFTDEDQELARDAVNAFAQIYVTQRQEQATDFYASRRQIVVDQVTELESAIEDADSDLARLRNSLVGLSATSDERTEINNEIAVINAGRVSDVSGLRTAKNSLTTIELDQVSASAPAEVLELARLPRAAIGLGPRTVYGAATILGLIAGVALAFLLHRLDSTARDRLSIERALGVDVLAAIPAFGLGRSRGSAALVMMSHGKSARMQMAKEAFRRLRSSIQFISSASDRTVLIFTSAAPGEGKSTTAANAAVSLAQSGRRVVLVSADLRRPSLEKLLGIEEAKGLGDWFADTLDDNGLPHQEIMENLVLIPAGQLPANPGELLASERFGMLLTELKNEAEFVLVDTPPVLNTADAVGASVHADGVIIVVDSKRTETDALLQIRYDIDRAGGQLLGAVLNKERQQLMAGYRNKYSYERVAASAAQ